MIGPSNHPALNTSCVIKEPVSALWNDSVEGPGSVPPTCRDLTSSLHFFSHLSRESVCVLCESLVYRYLQPRRTQKNLIETAQVGLQHEVLPHSADFGFGFAQGGRAGSASSFIFSSEQCNIHYPWIIKRIMVIRPHYQQLSTYHNTN